MEDEEEKGRKIIKEWEEKEGDKRVGRRRWRIGRMWRRRE